MTQYLPDHVAERVTRIGEGVSVRESGVGIELKFGAMTYERLTEKQEQKLCDLLRDREHRRKKWA